jgi:hypothetical protein
MWLRIDDNVRQKKQTVKSVYYIFINFSLLTAYMHFFDTKKTLSSFSQYRFFTVHSSTGT